MGQKLIANTLFNLMGQAFVFILALAVTPYLVHGLGNELYGLIALVGTIAGFTGLLNLGIGTALAKFVAELYLQKDFKRIRELFQSALGVALVAGGAACASLVAFRRVFAAAFFHASASAERFASFAILMAAVGLLLSLASGPFGAIRTGLQRFDVSNLLSILNAVVWYLGGATALALGFHVRAVLLVDLAGSVISFVISVLYARRLISGLPLRPTLRMADLRHLFRFSFYVIVAAVTSLVVHRFDNVLVAYFLPIATLTFYVVPYSLAEKTWRGVGMVTSVVFPSASELSAMREKERLQQLYLRATKMTLLAAMPVTLVLLAVPGPILGFWVGKEFAPRSALVMRLLAGGFLINILGHVPYVIAQGVGRPQIPAKYSAVNAIVNLVFFVVLIPRLGIVGAGLGFFLSEIMVIPLLVHEVNQLLEVSWLSLASQAYLRPLACGFFGFGTLWLCRGYADSLVNLMVVTSLALSLFAGLALFAAVDRKERRGVYQEAARMLQRARSLASA